MREAIVLRLESRSIVIRALTDTSELELSLGELTVEKPDYVIRDASNDEHFKCFIGMSLRNWWIAHNDAGYADGFMVAFDATRGLCMVAMNNTVSILTVAGEQWS